MCICGLKRLCWYFNAFVQLIPVTDVESLMWLTYELLQIIVQIINLPSLMRYEMNVSFLANLIVFYTFTATSATDRRISY